MNKSKLISGLSLIICLFALIQTKAADFYWVGGSGNWSDISHWRTTSGGATYPSVVPGSSDNVYFDANSGFTTTSKTVTLNVTGNCHNITFAGSSVAPTLTESGFQTLNIYGSSVWQSGMPAINISYIYYRNTGEAKTITSNGVKTGNRDVYLEETNSISLSDAFSVELFLYHQAGTFRTNGHDLTIGYSFDARTSSPKTIILGSSQVYMTATRAIFNTNQANITLNAGTSHIHFPNISSFQFTEGILPYQGQTFYNVSFENSNGGGSLGGNQTGTVYFNRVEFKGNGNIYQNNQFKELVFNAGKTYTLQANKTQTTQSWILGGTPCAVTFVQNSTTGLRANINVTGGNTNFNFGNLKEINASGQTLHFGAQSTIAGQNNNNITYDPYNPGAFAGLGADWLCHTVDDADSSTYLIPTDAFYGNSSTTYSWHKLNDSNYNPATVLGTGNTIDIRNFGFGTYKVEVTYTDGASITCVVSDEINILQRTVAPTASSLVCSKVNNTLADITVNGTNPKWYADNTTNTELPSNTAITNGATYYASQTQNNCESTRTAVTISIVLCNKAVMVNPNLRVRTK